MRDCGEGTAAPTQELDRLLPPFSVAAMPPLHAMLLCFIVNARSATTQPVRHPDRRFGGGFRSTFREMRGKKVLVGQFLPARIFLQGSSSEGAEDRCKSTSTLTYIHGPFTCPRSEAFFANHFISTWPQDVPHLCSLGSFGSSGCLCVCVCGLCVCVISIKKLRGVIWV
jgi:hypothetical protein